MYLNEILEFLPIVVVVVGATDIIQSPVVIFPRDDLGPTNVKGPRVPPAVTVYVTRQFSPETVIVALPLITAELSG